MEIIIDEKNSTLERENINDFLKVTLKKDASLLYIENIENILESETHFYLEDGADLKIISKINLNSKTKSKLEHHVFHTGDNSKSEIKVRGVLKSDLDYFGNIEVSKSLKNINGFEDISFITEVENIKVNVVPALNISSKEVSIEHSFSLFKTPKEVLNYYMSRGFSEEDAKKEIKEQFLNI